MCYNLVTSKTSENFVQDETVVAEHRGGGNLFARFLSLGMKRNHSFALDGSRRLYLKEEIMSETTETLYYKGHLLRRKDNLIYYGTMAEKYIIMLQISSTETVADLQVATKVTVRLELTDPEVKSRDRVIKKAEKTSLYQALDVAAVWLDRALQPA